MFSTRLIVAAVTVAGLVLTGCSKSDEPVSKNKSPADVMALAKKTLDETSGLTLKLSTDNLPDGVTGIAGAEGVATDAPAFDGTLQIVLSGSSFAVPVVAVDGKTYAKIPLTPGWSDVDPGDYGAPEPAELVSADKGFSAMLGATTSLKAGKSVRGGVNNDEVLTAYTGVVPGTTMKAIIPSASGDTFEALYLVAADGELREARITGAFYKDSTELTYTVTFTDYGTTKDITAP
jgi:lipoprotein LprG